MSDLAPVEGAPVGKVAMGRETTAVVQRVIGEVRPHRLLIWLSIPSPARRGRVSGRIPRNRPARGSPSRAGLGSRRRGTDLALNRGARQTENGCDLRGKSKLLSRKKRGAATPLLAIARPRPVRP